MAPSYAVRPAKKLPKPGSKFAALTPKSTGCSMADLSGARAQSGRRSWILRKPADTTSQHSTTMAATAGSASAYNWDRRPHRGRSHLTLERRKLSAAARWCHAGSGFENAVAAKRDCSRPDSDRIDDQNAYFNANCMILGSREVLIRPKVGVPQIVLGFPGRKLFVTLYASARNSAVCAPRIRNIFDNAASNSHVPGP